MKNKDNNFKWLLSVLLTTLVACSGGNTGNQAPEGSIDTPVSDMRIDIGGTIDFSANSSDPDGNLPLTYLWNFGGSGIADTNTQAPGQMQFNNEGIFTVSYTVTDALGLADPTPATRVITVGNQAPDGSINMPAADTKIKVGDSINFSATSSDPNGDLPLTYLWNFGAGSGIADANTQAPGQIQFNNEGEFTVSFTVTDSLGLDSTPATRVITVGNQAPNGTIDAPSTDLTINVGNSLNFTATGNDPDDHLPLSYQWNFGGAGIANTNSEDPGLRQFNIAGTFTVSLTVTDSTGLADKTPDVVTIIVKTASQNPLPKSGWGLLSVDSEEIVAEDGAASNAFDGDNNTYWHSAYVPQPAAPQPHDIRISLGGTYQLSAFRHLPRQDGSTRGRTKSYRFYISLDGNSWTQVASGSFIDSANVQEVQFTPVQATYVRFESRSNYDGDNLTAVAELTLLGDLTTANLAPNGSIDDPSEDIIINIFDSLSFNGTASDFEGNVPFSYLWNFGAGSGIADASIEDPMVQFNNEGVFNVSFTVSDSRGVADPTPAVRTINVCTPPSSLIMAPENKHIQSSPSLNVQAYSCLDSGAHAGWGIRIKLKNSAGSTLAAFDDITATFTGLAKDEYTVEAIVIDQSGAEVGGTTNQVTQVGIGEYYVAVGDSITLGLQDNISSDNVSQDGRNNSSGFPPILNNLLTTFTADPHTVVNTGIAGATTVDGISLMPTTLASNPQAQYVLIQYGTNDAGIPLDKNSFQGNMQQMINLVKAAGKQAYLAKIPYAKGGFSARNSLIQEYNLAIDQLIADNGISAAAPDFYTYFQANQSEYADDLHPNGTGYQSMANMWSNELK